MKKIVWVIFVLVIFPWVAPAAELYIWTDERGVKCITDSPPTTQGPSRKITYQPDDPADIARWESERRAAAKKQEAIQRANEAREKARMESEARAAARASEARKAQARAQEERDKRADRLEREVDNTLRSSGYIPHADKFREAAALKAQQIREGTDVPMSAAEDSEYHTRQAINNEMRRHEILNH